MKLSEYLDVAKLMEHISSGVVDMRKHEFLPLTIFCYGRKATYEDIWDDVTTKTRGLIVNTENDPVIIARPFEKFFNLNHRGRPETELGELLKLQEPFITEKLDGSLGTYWEYEGHKGIATKRSFHSEQAEWATDYMHHLMTMNGDWAWPEGYTPVFEIIAQHIQHHVVHYSPEQDNRLVLIGLVNKESGFELQPGALQLYGTLNKVDVVESFPIRIFEALSQNRPNKEGYIATYDNGRLKVKIKHEEFLKLQKIAHHTTPKTIFQALKNGDEQVIKDALEFGSPYLQGKVREWVDLYKATYQHFLGRAQLLVEASLLPCTTRKETAAFFLGTDKLVAPVAFGMIDQKNYYESIWDLVETTIKMIKFEEVEAE